MSAVRLAAVLSCAAAVSCGGGSQGSEVPAGGGAGGSTGFGGGNACGETPGGDAGLPGVTNDRHTGGLSAAGGKCVRDRVLIRSGHLADLDAAGCAQLDALQIRTVIDLRQATGSTGVAAQPDADCVTSDTDYYNADIVKLVPPSSDYYLETLAALEPKLPEIFARLGKDGGVPAITHCVIGRDRASLTMGLLLLAVGVPAAEVLSDFVNNNESTVQAEWLQAVIDKVDGEGGIETYLQQHGVAPQQVAKLKEQALE